ncbi:RNA recognition motif domain-containing protein [Arcticibacter svalbardensis]|uniref:RNA recognition motif domain-containing protein n=1 Tax=Arcticibacter svalbardensis TaxID=1288027 RepID=UPI001F27C68F|nr:RNA-binding protein [Arcticibacter svalbardensis]
MASLPFKLEESDIKETFEEYGEVSSVKLVLDKETGRKKGFGFVEMPDDEQAKKAIEDLNGLEIFGRAIAVTQAEEKPNGGRKGGFGGGDRGSYNKGGYQKGGRDSGSY